MNIKPLADRVVVKTRSQEETTETGIVLPAVKTEKPDRGEVVAVGSGRLLNNGERAPMEVKVGDKIFFYKHSGTQIKVDGEDYLILEEKDLYAIVE